MFPSSAADDTPNGRVGYSKTSSQLVTTYAISNFQSDLPYTIVSQFTQTLLFAARMGPILLTCRKGPSNHPSIIHHIVDIFFSRTNSQMRRIATQRIVATWTSVTNITALWQFSKMNGARKAMGADNMWRWRTLIYASIAMRVLSASPQPTPKGACGFVDVLPESCNEGSREGDMISLHRKQHLSLPRPGMLLTSPGQNIVPLFYQSWAS